MDTQQFYMQNMMEKMIKAIIFVFYEFIFNLKIKESIKKIGNKYTFKIEQLNKKQRIEIDSGCFESKLIFFTLFKSHQMYIIIFHRFFLQVIINFIVKIFLLSILQNLNKFYQILLFKYLKLITFRNFSNILYLFILQKQQTIYYYLLQLQQIMRIHHHQDTITTNFKQQIPEFISKVYTILEKNQYKKVISWNQTGHQIEIKNIKKLENQILPIYFRHCKIKSFIRQLNMYRFHKTHQISKEKNHLFFKNQYFKKGDIKSLALIKRKKKQQEESISDQPSNSQKSDKSNLKNNSNQLFVELVQEIVKFSNLHPQIVPQMNKIFEVVNSILTQQDEVSYKDSSKRPSTMNIMQTIRDIPNEINSLQMMEYSCPLSDQEEQDD